MSLRLQAEADLELMLEGSTEWGMPIIAKGPDGTTQDLSGQVLRESVITNPETGEPVRSTNPVITLRLSSMNPEPNAGEIWYFEIPSTTDPTSAKIPFMQDGSKAMTFLRTHGMIKIRLTPVVQS